MRKHKFNLKTLRISLKYRPDILKVILRMRRCIKNKNLLLLKLKKRLKEMEAIYGNNTEPKQNDITNRINIGIGTETNDIVSPEVGDTVHIATKDFLDDTEDSPQKPKTQHKSSQTDYVIENTAKEIAVQPENLGWDIGKENDNKSIAEQVKEAAQDAMKESGMVYVESAGMYYDYKTGYYYNSELGLYYHTDTECYYYYSDEKQSFVFHSYPDKSVSHAQAALLAHKKRKAKKHKLDKKAEEDIDNLTKNLSQGGDTNDENHSKSKKSKKETDNSITFPSPKREEKNSENIFEENVEENNAVNSVNKDNIDEKLEKNAKSNELEDGECSETSSDDDDNDDGVLSPDVKPTTSSSDDESIAKHHPPCMRVIVRETSLPKLRVGTLFIVTKDGGTIGREGEHHTILLSDSNVSRNHMLIKYDSNRRLYVAIDLGSRNGSILNGSRMSESKIISEPVQIVHGSTLQLGETKLLCHIHSGNETCGHCEPGLLIEDVEKEKKVAYTRTCSVKKQHELELARLKNKYGQKPMLAIDETPYNDRAQARRTAVGSSHSAEKTQSSDIATSIAQDNKGFKLLEKMGWNKGEGLGKDNQGDTEPVPLVSNEGKTGLGAVPTPNNLGNTLGPATMRLATRTKMLRPPAKAFQGLLDEDFE